MFYYGIHSTNEINDGYLGSGRHLSIDKKKYGKDFFKKDILKFFNSREEASEYEKNIVTEELVRNNNCYNIKIGGDYGVTSGTILVTDKDGVMHRCTPTDERLLLKEWVPCATGKVFCIDKATGERVKLDKTIFHSNRDKYIAFSDGRVVVKDNNGKILTVDKSDERYKQGELVCIWKGKRHSDETKRKMSNSHKGMQSGERNSQYGTCWVTNFKESKKIKKEELVYYEKYGWVRGRKM